MSIKQAYWSGSPAHLQTGRIRQLMMFLLFSAALLAAGCTGGHPDSETTGHDATSAEADARDAHDTTASSIPDTGQDDRSGYLPDSAGAEQSPNLPFNPDDPDDRIVQDHQNLAGNQPQDTTMNQQDYNHKLDAPLRNRLARSGWENNGGVLEILIQLSGTADPEILEKLNRYRIEVRNVMGSIVTARGTGDAIYRAASDSAVISISLSTERQPND
jgi:hypothetical protein